ncbi:MAG: Flp pilus assembly protein CpaB [Planctomycetota bacterium]
MQTRTLLVGAFAVIFGVVSAVGAFVSQRRAATHTPTQEVVVAVGDMPWGTVLEPQHLRLSAFPVDSIPEGAVRKIEDATGRTSRDNLVKGQLLIAGRLTEPGVGRGLPPLIPKGMRAVSIQTPNVSSGVTGFVMPGNNVDVVLTMHGQGNDDPSGGGRTITLLQNVTVLAVDQNIEAPSENMMDLKQMRTVTLVVTPQQAQELDLGQNKGVLRLTLRNPLDEAISDVNQVTVSSLTSPNRGLDDATATSDVTGEHAEQKPATSEAAVSAAGSAITVTAAAPAAPKKKRQPLNVLVLRGTTMSRTTLFPQKAVPAAVKPTSEPAAPATVVSTDTVGFQD